MKPIIGIAPRLEEGYLFCNEVIRKVICKSGGIPLLLLPVLSFDCREKSPHKWPKYTKKEYEDFYAMLALCDGFILPGGSSWYPIDEILIEYAKEQRKPILGICLGMQEMAKSLLPNRKGDITILNNTKINHNNNSKDYVHQVKVWHDSLLYSILKKTNLYVNSRHSFHIPDISISYVNAKSSDGIIEGIELKNHPFFIGLQWHPEDLYDKKKESRLLFSFFIKVCMEKKANKN